MATKKDAVATAPTAEVATTEAIVKPIAPAPTSAKLTELYEKRKAHKIAARGFEPDSDEESAELLEAYKTDQLIKAEIANIKNAEAAAELEITRNKRISLNNNQFYALFGGEVAFDNFQAALPEEQRAEFWAAVEIVNTELLAKYSKPATVKVAADGTKTASTGEIDAAALANKNAGLNKKANNAALQAAGYPRSTAWFAVDRLAKSDASYV